MLRRALLYAFVAMIPILPATSPPSPTFYRDVLPILQDHCQVCHRTGEIGPMPLMTYAEARQWRMQIRTRTAHREMPPWFADPHVGKFANNPSLTDAQIATLSAWAEHDAPPGNPRNAPPPRRWAAGWLIAQPDRIIAMPKPVAIPATGDVEYTYEIVPTGFTQDMWARMVEIRPSSRAHVHHAVVYVRPPGSRWLVHAPLGVPFTASSLPTPADRRDAAWTTSDILLVYAPGSSPDRLPEGMAKFIPRGSDLVFQMHYTTNGHPSEDQTSVGIVFSRQPPEKRVLTLQLTNDRFLIPPGVPDYHVEVHGTLPNDALLLSFFPHMHLRGKEFEYNILHPGQDPLKDPLGDPETLLRVHYNFYWQLSYRLAEPRFLKAGTELQAVAVFDNSRHNPHNPDPDAAVRWGDQTSDEMMVGFFDVAVPRDMDKQSFFERRSSAGDARRPQ
jgi:hypothetical protein